MRHNSYYHAARHIAQAVSNNTDAQCTFQTMEQAVDDAKRKIRIGEANEVVIVKMVAIVKRDEPPVVMEFLNSYDNFKQQ